LFFFKRGSSDSNPSRSTDSSFIIDDGVGSEFVSSLGVGGSGL